MEFSVDKNFAEELDSIDSLASYRDHFSIPKTKDGNESIYLCGNSLGLQPKKVPEYVNSALADWAKYGVEGHFSGDSPWLPYHEFLTESLAKIVGAKPIEVVAMNTLTVNIHLMMVSFYRPTSERLKILRVAHTFPSDRYAQITQARFHGFDPAEAIVELPSSQIEEYLEREGESVALILMDGVNYYSGEALDFKKIVELGHNKGCFVGFDLAHGVGNIELHLHDWNVDFAAWCSYKYLNGGPGCIAGCFVHEKHANNIDIPRFGGWWGNNKERRFLMGPDFEPIAGAEGWQLSNPPILPLAALRASLELFDEIGMKALREKSVKLTSYLEFLIRESCSDRVEIITPSDSAKRGCQLSLLVAGGKKSYDKLTKNGVICDWREPDVVRIAPVPFYNSFSDVYRFAEILSDE